MWVAALLTASCTPALKVEVANTTPTERDDETVEIAWSEVAALKGVTPDNIVVLNDDAFCSKSDTMRWWFRLPAYSCDFEQTR